MKAEFPKAGDAAQALDMTLTRGWQETDLASQKWLWVEAENRLHVSPTLCHPHSIPCNTPISAREHPHLIHLDPRVRKVHFRPSLTFPGGNLALTSQSVCDISISTE